MGVTAELGLGTRRWVSGQEGLSGRWKQQKQRGPEGSGSGTASEARARTPCVPPVRTFAQFLSALVALNHTPLCIN